MFDLEVINPGHSLLTLYLIIAGNFLAPLFGCRLQNFIESNLIMRHYIGFLTLLLFVRLTAVSNAKFKNILGSAILLYLWFLATTRVNFTIWTIIISLASILFFIHYYESSEKDPEYKETLFDTYLPKIKKGLLISMAGITLFGLILYIGEKKAEYGDKFLWSKFFIGTYPCKNKTPEFTIEDIMKALAK